MAILTAFPGGEAPASIPEFTFTGSYSLIDDGDGNWRIKFLTSGTLTVTNADFSIDLFLSGGGAGGGSNASAHKGGGGGGYTNTQLSITLVKNTSYTMTVGAGGSVEVAGGTSSAFGYSASGGYTTTTNNGANGGSGGGERYGHGGTDGNDGTASVDSPGIGQHTTTKEFGESSGTLYSNGGHGGDSGYTLNAGLANTGDAGDAGYAGGSGIVVIRNHRAA